MPCSMHFLLVFLVNLAGIPETAEPIQFLPDDAQVSCRAILPQCFRREDWARLCQTDQSILDAHPLACRRALEP